VPHPGSAQRGGPIDPRIAMNTIQHLHQPERGQTMVEYGFILFFVALVGVITLVALGPDLNAIFASVASKL
jgi:Flp pilus assembly pilin Flp